MFLHRTAPRDLNGGTDLCSALPSGTSRTNLRDGRRSRREIRRLKRVTAINVKADLDGKCGRFSEESLQCSPTSFEYPGHHLAARGETGCFHAATKII